MNKIHKTRAIIASSYMLFLLGHLDNKDKVKGSVALLRQKLFSKVSKEDKELAKIANIAWDNVSSNVEYAISISVSVESIFFEFENELSQYLGNDFGLVVSRATMKLPTDDKSISNSYKFIGELKKSVDKIVYDKIKSGEII